MHNEHESPWLRMRGHLEGPIKWALAASLLTAVLVLFMPNHYKSEARLLPVESKGLGGSLGGLASAAAAFGVALPGGDTSDANFTDILNSRSLAEQLLGTTYKYHIRSWMFGSERVETGTLYDYLDERNRSKALRKFEKLYLTTRDFKTKVISISAETKSPELSQLIVKRASALLEAFVKEKGRTRGGSKVLFAEARLAEARKEMDEAEENWRRFLEVNRNYQSITDPAVRLKGARLENELRLRQQLVTTLAMNREQALLEEKNDIPILNVMDPADLPSEKSSPTRSLMVVGVFALVLSARLVWEKQLVLQRYLRAD